MTAWTVNERAGEKSYRCFSAPLTPTPDLAGPASEAYSLVDAVLKVSQSAAPKAGVLLHPTVTNRPGPSATAPRPSVRAITQSWTPQVRVL